MLFLYIPLHWVFFQLNLAKRIHGFNEWLKSSQGRTISLIKREHNEENSWVLVFGYFQIYLIEGVTKSLGFFASNIYFNLQFLVQVSEQCVPLPFVFVMDRSICMYIQQEISRFIAHKNLIFCLTVACHSWVRKMADVNKFCKQNSKIWFVFFL